MPLDVPDWAFQWFSAAQCPGLRVLSVTYFSWVALAGMRSLVLLAVGGNIHTQFVNGHVLAMLVW